jgi:phosphopantetheinyl transferase (holo-ACP synthase)
MSILGVGTDLVNIKRIEAILKKNKNLFLKKYYTPKN